MNPCTLSCILTSMPPSSYATSHFLQVTGLKFANAGAAEDEPSGAARECSKKVIGLTADTTVRTHSAPAALAVHKAENDEEIKAPRLSAWTAFLCLVAVAQARQGSTSSTGSSNCSRSVKTSTFFNMPFSLLFSFLITCLLDACACQHLHSWLEVLGETLYGSWVSSFGTLTLGLKTELRRSSQVHRWRWDCGWWRRCAGGRVCSRGTAVARVPLPGGGGSPRSGSSSRLPSGARAPRRRQGFRNLP